MEKGTKKILTVFLIIYRTPIISNFVDYVFWVKKPFIIFDFETIVLIVVLHNAFHAFHAFD